MRTMFNENQSDCNYITTLLLCILLGYFGVHRFYAGKAGTGVLMFLTFGLGGIWWIIDMILVAAGGFRDKQGRLIKP